MNFHDSTISNWTEKSTSDFGSELPPFDHLYTNYRDMVFRICMRYSNDADDARDLVQDVFLKVFKAKDSFRGKSRISTWIYSVTVNEALDFIRKKNREKERYVQLEKEIEGESYLEDDFQIDRKAVREVLSKVGEIDRNILLKIIDGFNQSQIAAQLGVSRVAISRRISRIRSQLTNRKNEKNAKNSVSRGRALDYEREFKKGVPERDGALYEIDFSVFLRDCSQPISNRFGCYEPIVANGCETYMREREAPHRFQENYLASTNVGGYEQKLFLGDIVASSNSDDTLFSGPSEISIKKKPVDRICNLEEVRGDNHLLFAVL